MVTCRNATRAVCVRFRAIDFLLAAALSLAGCSGGRTQEIGFKTPEKLLRKFIESVQTRNVKSVLSCVRPDMRWRIRPMLDACLERQEARDIAIGYLRRRFRGTISAADHIHRLGYGVP